MSYAMITVLGHVGQDPEIKNLNNGHITARFSLAHNKSWTNANGEKVKSVTWFDVEAYQANEKGVVTGLIQPWVRKGGKVLVSGEPTIQEYVDTQGVKRRVFRIKLGPSSVISLEGDRNGANGHEKPAGDAAPAADSTLPSEDPPF